MKRQPLSRARVLSAAVELLDAEGLAALSMRKLGERLGVEAMSLYRYVSGKEDLLNGVHASVLGEMPPPSRRGKWQTRLRKVARSFRAVLEAHPNALPLFATRPAIAATSLDAVEACLEILASAGFSAKDSALAFQSLAGFVIGTASLHFGAEHEPESAPALDPALHPLLCEIYQHVDPDKEFAFGLDLLVRGLEEQLTRP